MLTAEITKRVSKWLTWETELKSTEDPESSCQDHWSHDGSYATLVRYPETFLVTRGWQQSRGVIQTGTVCNHMSFSHPVPGVEWEPNQWASNKCWARGPWVSAPAHSGVQGLRNTASAQCINSFCEQSRVGAYQLWKSQTVGTEEMCVCCTHMYIGGQLESATEDRHVWLLR